MEFKQPFTFGLIVLGHVGVFIVSAYWLKKVIEIGATSLNEPIVSSAILQQKHRAAWYMFEVWHGRGLIEQITSEHAGYLSQVQCKVTSKKFYNYFYF